MSNYDFSGFKSNPPHGMYVERADDILVLSHRETTFTIKKIGDEFRLHSKTSNRKENEEHGDCVYRTDALPRALKLLGYMKDVRANPTKTPSLLRL